MDGNINAALILLDRAIDDLEVGFVPCKRCGDQEDTKNLDCMSDLKSAQKELLAFVDRQQKTNHGN